MHMRKAWFKLTRNATGRQLLWELVTTESGASGYRTTGRINLKRHQMKNLTHVSVEDIERKAWDIISSGVPYLSPRRLTDEAYPVIVGAVRFFLGGSDASQERPPLYAPDCEALAAQYGENI